MADDAGTPVLLVRLGSSALAFPVEAVLEVLPMPELVPVPGMPSWLPGIAGVRGRVQAVVDLTAHLAPQRAGGPFHRAVHLRVGTCAALVRVDEVLGIESVSVTPPTPPRTPLVRGVAVAADRPVAVVDVDEVLALRHALPH